MEQASPKQKYTSIETAELERLRAQVSKVPMAPHTFAQMVNRVRDLAFDFGTTEQFRDRVAELLGEYVDDRVPEQRIPEESGPVPDYTGEGSAWVPPKPVGDAALVKVHSWQKVLGPVGAMVWVDPQEVLRVAGIRT